MIDNQPTRDMASIWKSISDPNKKEERLMVKRREQIKQERETDYCLTDKNEE
jgi:hypothetical protein